MLKRIAIFIHLPKTKNVLLGIWITLIIAAIVVYVLFPKEFTAKGIKEFIAQFSTVAMIVYFLVS